EPDLLVPVPKSFHEQTDEELTENDIKQMDADDQAIQTILLGLHEDVYAAVDSYEESIKSYYHRFMQLMNDLKRNKHFPENIASNLKFLNNLQPEWKRHVTIVCQTKNLHEADFTQIYDFLKTDQDEEMVGIGLDSTLDKWLRISKVTMHGRMVGFKLLRRQVRMRVFRVVKIRMGLLLYQGLPTIMELVMLFAARAEGTRNGNQVKCYNCRGLGHIARNCTARPRRRDAA
nr:hypothetical protein [Tanacetum cinerariifolium]